MQIAANLLNGITSKGVMLNRPDDVTFEYRLEILGMSLFLNGRPHTVSNYAIDLARIDPDDGQVWSVTLSCHGGAAGLLRFDQTHTVPRQPDGPKPLIRWVSGEDLYETGIDGGADELKRDLLLLHMIFGGSDADL